MHQYPFAMLMGVGTNGMPVATQIPFLIKETENKLFLRGHIMRQTDHHKAFMQNPQALVVFTGPQTYVSASWYSNPLQGSTWNYMSVHARGVIRFLEEAELFQVLRETTALFENNPQSPALFDKLESDYVNKLAKAIIAIEIEVQQVENVFKLSQNRDKESYLNIIDQLKKGNEDAQQIASEMQARFEILYQDK